MDKTEMNPAPPSESAEQQLSITFDDIGKKPAIMSAEEYLKIQKSLKEQGTAAPKSDEKPVELPKEDNSQNVKNDASKPDEKARENAPLAPAPHLSDMEVMEHTASIWQYKEIVDNGTEMHSEYHEKRTVTPFAEVTGARVRGKKHKHEGTNCDDYFETAVTDDCVIAVVCDGAGSKPLSRIGSRVSAETAAAYLKAKTTELFSAMPALKSGLAADLNSAEFMAACGRVAPLVQEAAREAFAAQQNELSKLSEDKRYKDALGRKPVIGDLSTTFLAAVIVPVEVGGKPQAFMACVQIGDGCICAIDSAADSAHCLKLMGEADSGAFSGETDFLSEKNSKAEVIGAKTRISRGSSDTVLLMSDGVADDYFPAQPMMQRLYLDLCLNGVLPMEGERGRGGEDPAPIRFRSVSLTQQSVALQYAKQLLGDKSEEAMAALWDKRGMLWCHSLEAFRMNIGDTPEERLRVWLDNYNERGSFDDRTLVSVRVLR
ncbi:MAG: protein phosphatase 2C domain-containing protein [Lachnospiraceae bacterium]|nr:protein phosphatase 2C domain-containing protein [Ruminococcus sp.]MCM1273941.1 protein phosphatase 2C domain-containing protein [Lachnospiraceae bacterium]